MKRFSWKTTLFGITALFTGVKLCLLGQFTEGISSICSGIGLIAAKDFDHSN
jgi:hypothetical protein